jgi:hypothetical protein
MVKKHEIVTAHTQEKSGLKSVLANREICLKEIIKALLIR